MTTSTAPHEQLDIQEAGRRAGALAEALDALREGQERMLTLAAVREAAIREAKPAGLAEALRAETDEIKTIAATDAVRAEHAGGLAARLGFSARSRPRVTEIAERLPAPLAAERRRLEQSASALREAIERVAQRTASDRLGAERLAQHMRGLIETAAERLGRCGGYGQRGERKTAAAVPVGIDVTS